MSIVPGKPLKMMRNKPGHTMGQLIVIGSIRVINLVGLLLCGG